MTNATTTQLERLAIDLDAAPTFDADVAAWLTDLRPQDASLVAIMNDPTETESVRARALSLLVADMLSD